ncbi:MAG: hypothetical protein R3F59_36775 [Myxococcota bacterium]
MPDDLQFDTAEYAAPPPCAVCGALLRGPHYRVGPQAVCPACRERILEHEAHTASPDALGQALGWGLAAAAASTLLWMQLRELAGDFRIAALGVAWAVAWAVRRGAGGGGRPHQVVAALYTAGAIAAYVATAPRLPTDSASAVFWLVIAGVSVGSAWTRTAAHPVAFGDLVEPGSR